MDHINILEVIKTAVREIKKDKKDFISIDAFETYLDRLGESVEKFEINKKPSEIEIESFKAKCESDLAYYKAQCDYDLEVLRTAVSSGQAALKSTILVNGGAAVALLAFLGKIWEKGSTQIAIASLCLALSFFVSGVLTGAIASGTTYITNSCYSVKKAKTGICFHIITILLVIASYLLFGSGSYYSYKAFINQLLT